MGALLNIAEFSGQQTGAISASYTCSHGISPSIATLTLPNVGRPPAGAGALVITDGFGVLRLNNAKIDRASVKRSTGGNFLTLYILDRRWKWKFGSISGTYNVRDSSGVILPYTLRTAVQLAQACLFEMGEFNFAIEGIPATEFPPVNWDHDNPAQALQSLVEQYDCRIVYRPSSDSVLIARRGFGFGLPNGPIVESNPGIDFPERPAQIAVVGAPIRYQAMFVLEAVGLDIDGQIRPLDQLSYKPTAGWTVCAPPNFPQLPRLALDPRSNCLTAEEQYQKTIDLAAQSVYKWYRISVDDRILGTNNNFVPGFGEPIRREQIILENARLDTEIRPDGSIVDAPPLVMGTFDRRTLRTKESTNLQFGGNVGNAEFVDSGFTIDSERGIVVFDEPIFMAGTGADKGKIFPAELVLLCSCQMRDSVTNQIVRYEFRLAGNGDGANVEVIHRPELSYRIKANYTLTNPNQDLDPAVWQFVGLTNNAATIDPVALVYAEIAASAYQLDLPIEIEYAGIQPIAPDGAIQQISWEVGPDGPRTRASRNTEHAYWFPTFEERRRVQLQPIRVDRTPPPKRGFVGVRDMKRVEQLRPDFF